MGAIQRGLLPAVAISVAACSGSASVYVGDPGSRGFAPSLAEISPPSGWRKLSLPPPPGGPTAGYTDSGSAIACKSKTDCIFGSTYLDANGNQYSITASTTNAGLTWARNTSFPYSLDGGVASAACDQRYCFILAENAAVTGQALARTQDNGKRWAVVPYPRSWTKDSIDAAMIACSSSRCLVYGDGTFATTPTAGDQTAFAATSNNFQTWTDIALPGANQIDELACIWSGQCWAEYETSADDFEHFATTLNGGATWTVLGPISPSPTRGTQCGTL